MKRKHKLEVTITVDEEKSLDKVYAVGSGQIVFEGNPEILAAVVVNAMLEEQSEALAAFIMEVNKQAIDELKRRVGGLSNDLEETIKDEIFKRKLRNTKNEQVN